jgi:hypothetical protein
MMFSGIKWHWDGPFQPAHIEKIELVKLDKVLYV